MISDPGPCPNQGNYLPSPVVRPFGALRTLLISRGAIVPRKPLPRPTVLRLDDRGKRAARRHMEEYRADPWMWQSRPFWFPDPDAWIDEREYPVAS